MISKAVYNKLIMWDQIEPLGMNCEVGFVLEHHLQTEGLLLKWCFTPLSTLEKMLTLMQK
jgi:hypothetical protein